MKLIICSAILCALVTVEAGIPDPSKLKNFFENMRKCAAELKLDFTSLNPTSGPADLRKFLEDGKNKCLSKCMMEKFGVIDKSGNFVAEKAESLIPPGKNLSVEKVKECFDKFKDGDVCTKYKSIQVCLFRMKN